MQSLFTPSSSMYSDPAVLGPQGEHRVVIERSHAEASSRQTPLAPAPQSFLAQVNAQINDPIRTFFQSAIDRRARNAEMAQARVEGWSSSPYFGKKKPRADGWKGLGSLLLESPEPLVSPKSIPGQRSYLSTPHESLVLPWRSSVGSGISSLSSGWGDGPPIPTPVLISQEPVMGHKIMTRGSIAQVREMV